MYWRTANLIPVPQNPRAVPHATREISYHDLGHRKLSGKPVFAEENINQQRSNYRQNDDMNMTVSDEGEIEIVFFNAIDASRLGGFKEHPSGI